MGADEVEIAKTKGEVFITPLLCSREPRSSTCLALWKRLGMVVLFNLCHVRLLDGRAHLSRPTRWRVMGCARAMIS